MLVSKIVKVVEHLLGTEGGIAPEGDSIIFELCWDVPSFPIRKYLV